MKEYFLMVAIMALGFTASSEVDCFQEVAQRAENGLIDGFVDSLPFEQGMALLAAEMTQCTGLSGPALYVALVQNYARLKSEKHGTAFEFYMTWVLASYLEKQVSSSSPEVIQGVVVLFYESEGKARKVYLEALGAEAFIRDDEENLDRLWGYDFSPHKSLLDSETNKTSVLGLALLDFMFTCAPGKALLTLNASASAEELEILKSTVAPLLRLHNRKDPNSWAKKDLQPYKDAMHSVITSNYAYRDLFLAEIVHVVHDLKTPEVEAFLAHSTSPLVRRRLEHPFEFVLPELPE